MASEASSTGAKSCGVRQCWLWLDTFLLFLVGLALFIPSAFSATWVTIPAASNSSSAKHLSAGLWTDCNSTTHLCDDYNAAYLDASAALVILATVTVFISGVTHMLPWMSAMSQVITGFVSLIAVIVFMSSNTDLDFGWAVPVFSASVVIFVINGMFSFVALGYPEMRRVASEGKVIKSQVKVCCYCKTCSCCCDDPRDLAQGHVTVTDLS